MSDEDRPPPISPVRRLVEIIFGLLLVWIFATFYTSVLIAFHREASNRTTVLVDAENLDSPSIDGRMTVTGVDPVKGELGARITLECDDSLLGSDKYTLNRDLFVSVNSVKGKQLELFKRGTRVPPIDVTLALFDGEPMEYPYDVHKAELYLDVSYTQASKDGGEDEAFIPVGMVFEAAAPGYVFEVHDALPVSQKNTNGFESVAIQISRSATVKGFSLFTIGLIWCIAVTILVLTLAVWLRGRKFEFGMMTFFAAMLFAFPAIRNLQPMVPPIGAWPDFVAVFWAQGIAGACIVIMLGVWLSRPQKG